MKSPFFRFLIAGAANTAATYAAYLMLLRVVPYIWAYTSAFVAGILIAYALQTRYVFRVRRSWGTFMKFPLVYLLQYAVGAMGLRLLVEGELLSKEVALLATLLVTVPLGFLLSRYVLKVRSENRDQ